MPMTFDEELRSIHSKATTERLAALATAATAPDEDLPETAEDVAGLFHAFAFCREHRLALTTKSVSVTVGSGRWVRVFDYDCVVVETAAGATIDTGLFYKTGPGDRILKEDENKIRLINIDTFSCAAVGAKACAMHLARIGARELIK